MDPNEVLRRFRELYNDEETFADNLHLMVGLMADLDDWLTKGGFLPKDWERTEQPTPKCCGADMEPVNFKFQCSHRSHHTQIRRHHEPRNPRVAE